MLPPARQALQCAHAAASIFIFWTIFSDMEPTQDNPASQQSPSPEDLVQQPAAENAAESLQRGMRVIAQGRLQQRSYETREGEKRTVIEMQVDEIGPSLRYATAKVNRTQRGSSSGGGFGSSGSDAAGGGEDPWGSAPPAGGGGFTDEPPF